MRGLVGIKMLAAFAVAGALVVGCDFSNEGAPSAASTHDDNNFVAFEAESVTNITLSSSRNITMGYSALDGTGELRRLFNPSAAFSSGEALAHIEKECTRVSDADKAVLIPLYLKETQLPGAIGHGGFDVWSVAKDLFLVVEKESGGSPKIVCCDFVLCDGRSLRRLAPFPAPPESEIVWECIRQSRGNPAALNNIAAMLFNGVALRSAVTMRYINFLLLMAAGAGDTIACRNLAILYASSLSSDMDKDYKRDFWLRRTRETVLEKQQGFAPALEARTIDEWPR